MKNKRIYLILILFFISGILSYLHWRTQVANAIYLNAADKPSYLRLKKLGKALKKEGKTVFISKKDHFKSGKFNIYGAENDLNLPAVIDASAINFLWTPAVPQDTIESYRPFDVIVVQNIPSFSYLKAINVRTAYIPEAINLYKKPAKRKSEGVMYYGDIIENFSLSLYLAGPTDLKVDVYGNGFENLWDEKEIMNRPVEVADFLRYAIVLVDQSEENIKDELINQRIIRIIESGGLPYIRYNSGVAKIFGDAIPMYMNQAEFLPKIQHLLANPQERTDHLEAIYQTAQQWNSSSQAKKFLELFDIMEKKMITKD